MSLGLYTDADPATNISSEDGFTNPLLITIDGKVGGVLQTKIYARNSDATKSYLNIRVTPVYTSDPDFINDAEGISWKLFAGEIQPTDDQWDTVTPPNTINLTDIGTESVSDTTTYLPFWVRVAIPRMTDIQTIKGIKLQVISDEVLI